MTNEEKILALLQQMQGDISDLNQGQMTANTRLDTTMARLDTTVARLDTTIARLDNLEAKQDKLSADVAEMNHFTKPALKAIREGIKGLQERNRQLDLLDSKVGDHDHRLFAVEQKLKKAE